MRHGWWLPLIALLASPVWAKRVDNLYHAQVVLARNAPEEVAQGMQRAWQQVLVKVAGSREVLQRKAARDSIPTAEKHAARSSVVAHATTSHWRVLNVSFSPDAVRDTLRRAGVSPWNPDRPLTLVWLALREGSRETFVNPEQAVQAYRSLAGQAQRRGLPVLFPVLDRVDWQALSVAQLRAGQEAPLRRAAGRYAPASVLGGYVQSQNGYWHATWFAFVGTQVVRWQSRSKDIHGLLREGIDTLTDHLAPKPGNAPIAAPTPSVTQPPENPANAGRENPDGSFEILVDQVTDFGDYARVQRALTQIDGASEVQLVEIAPQRARFRLMLPGGTNALTAQLRHILAPVGTGVYRLQP